jgi:formate dehydrogenase maturation protein FdhE
MLCSVALLPMFEPESPDALLAEIRELAAYFKSRQQPQYLPLLRAFYVQARTAPIEPAAESLQHFRILQRVAGLGPDPVPESASRGGCNTCPPLAPGVSPSVQTILNLAGRMLFRCGVCRSEWVHDYEKGGVQTTS